MLQQLSIYAENKKGTMQNITEVLADENINIWGSCTNDGAEYGINRMVVSDPQRAMEALEAVGYLCKLTSVIGVEVEDEVGNLSYETQVQLLRALQERRIRPVGGSREIPVDIRLIAATNEDLEAAIARGAFRADLYHRINEFTLRMPELRQMRGDIMLFADFFLDAANRELDKRIVGFDPQAAAGMSPETLRQMKNAVMSATLLCTGDYITCRELPAELSEAPETPAVPLRNPAGEEEQIRRALAMAGGNKSQAAKLLGIDRKTLYNKLHLYGIE